jgi:hypothetical protein
MQLRHMAQGSDNSAIANGEVRANPLGNRTRALLGVRFGTYNSASTDAGPANLADYASYPPQCFRVLLRLLAIVSLLVEPPEDDYLLAIEGPIAQGVTCSVAIPC